MKNVTKAQQQSRLLYIIMITALVIAAIIIAATGSARREKAAENTTAQTEIETPEAVENMASPLEGTESAAPATSSSANIGVAAEPVDVLPSFTAPAIGTVTKYHSLDVPVYSLTMSDYRTHSGIDISAQIGGEVLAAADGVIGEIWEDPMMGMCMTILHSGNAVSTYKNLAAELPEGIVAGSAVSGGQVIAAVGESALIEIADEPHIHYELAVSGNPVNPLEYIVISQDASIVE